MPHELEIHNGQAAFAAAREPGWHGLGYVAAEEMTAETLLDRAHLGGWNTRKIPAVGFDGRNFVDGGGQDFMTIRDNPFTGITERLGMVGPTYQVYSNERLADYMQTLVDLVGGAIFDTGGSLDDGRRVFMTMQLPGTMTIGGRDDLRVFIAAFNNHDGGRGQITVTTPVRVVCANTERAALRNHHSIHTIQHSGNLEGKIADARQALRLNFKYMEAFEAEAQKMIRKQMDRREYRKFAKTLFPVPRDASDLVKRRNADVLHQLTYLFAKSDTQENIRGTRWAAYNSVTEYLDWYGRVPSTRNAGQVLAARALVDDHRNAETKKQAFKLLQVG